MSEVNPCYFIQQPRAAMTVDLWGYYNYPTLSYIANDDIIFCNAAKKFGKVRGEKGNLHSA